MKLLKAIAMALAVVASLTACSALKAKPNPAQGYSFTHRDFDLRYAWNTSQDDRGVRVEGLIKNVRYPRIEQVEVDVALLDKARNVLARGTAFPVPQPIDVDDYRSYGIELRNAKISQGDLLRFQVSYVASAGQSSFNWKSSFTVNAATGKVIGVGTRSDEDSW